MKIFLFSYLLLVLPGTVLGFGFGLSKDSDRLWPKGIIPYEIDPQLDAGLVLKAMKAWESKTSIRFIERTLETSYANIFLVEGLVSSSPVGKEPIATPVRISTSASVATIIHELGHLIGLHHEHQRPDRDQFIQIHVKNSTPDAKLSLKKVKAYKMYGNYDHNSIMHYEQYTFSNEGPVIEGRDKPVRIFETNKLSKGDITTVAAMYAEEFRNRSPFDFPKISFGCSLVCKRLTSEWKRMCFETCMNDKIDAEAAKTCDRYTSQESTLNCVSVVAGKSFQAGTVAMCDSYDETALTTECLKIMADKTIQPDALAACRRFENREFANQCLEATAGKKISRKKIAQCDAIQDEPKSIRCFQSL